MIVPSLFAFRCPPLVPPPCGKAASGSPQFPSYPFENMPWSQTPVVTRTLAITHTSLLPSDTIQRVGFRPAVWGLSFRTTIIHFSGLNTEPAISLHPAPDSRYRVCPWTSLMSCWLNFAHMGLPQIDCSEPEQAPLRDLPFNPSSSVPGQALQKGTCLPPCAVTHWVTLSNFTSLWRLPTIRASLGARTDRLYELLFSPLKYYPKARKKHRCPFSIFNIIFTKPLQEFWFLNSF